MFIPSQSEVYEGKKSSSSKEEYDYWVNVGAYLILIRDEPHNSWVAKLNKYMEERSNAFPK